MRASVESARGGRPAGLRRLAAAGAAALLAALASGCATTGGRASAEGKGADRAGDARSFDFGCLASRRTDLHGNRRLRALGPVFESARSVEGDRLTAVRPLWSRTRNPAKDWSYAEYLWPLGWSKRLKNDASWRFVLCYATRFDVTDPRSRYRFWLFPIYFQGRAATGERYAAVFPIGGELREFFMQDRIRFALFPLLSDSWIGDVHTRDVLWPVFSRSEGKGIHRVRVFPFYAHSIHRGLYEKRFVMWPFWTSARYTDPRSPGGGFILLPVCGYVRLPDQKTWMLLPPLFRWTRGERLNQVYAPWPIIQYSSGQSRKLWVWPLFGRHQRAGVELAWVAWPIVWREKIDRRDAVVRRWMVMPFYQHETIRRRQPPAGDAPRVTARHVKIWPLASYRREGDARMWRLLELWPLRNTPQAERSWAPLWTLCEYRACADASDFEILWGLVRRERRAAGAVRTSVFPFADWSRSDAAAGGGAASSEWNVLKGLVGRRREGGRVRWRWLYVFRTGRGGE